MSEDSKSIVFSKTVIEVITIANDLCIFLEEFDKYELEFSLLYLQKVLPLLYLKGALMPDLENINQESNERFVIQEQWEDIYNRIKQKTGVIDAFYYVNANAKTATQAGFLQRKTKK